MHERRDAASQSSSDLEDPVDGFVSELALPGVAVAVVRSGEPPTILCRGSADLATGRAVGPATQFRIGSITKTMTTLAVLRLVEDGRVGLDDPVTDHVAVRIHQPRGSRPVTVRDLLTHRSGIGEIASWRALLHPMWAVGGSRAGEPPPPLAVLAAAGYRAEAPAGQRWVYANPGFTILGHLVEEVTGRRFADVLSAWVFEPCGMAATTLDPTVASDLAVGYRLKHGQPVPVRPFTVATVSAGGVISTIEDLAGYASMLLAGGMGIRGQVVGPDTLADAFRPQHEPHQALKAIGLTFRIRRSHGRLLIGHNGSMPGWNAAAVLCPSERVAIVVLTNRSVPPAAEFGAGRMANAMLTAVLDTHTPSRKSPSATRPEPVSRTATVSTNGLAGRYRVPPGVFTNVRAYVLFGGELLVSHGDGGRLTVRGRAGPLRRPRQLEADAVDPCVFHLDLDGVDLPVAFVRGPDGQGESVWLDGIPTPFALRRCRPGPGPLIAAGAVLLMGALLLSRRIRRQR